jgi:hypothetical protein
MSLFPELWQPGPSTKDYQRRESIPVEEWCEACDGLGSKRLRFSGCFGNNRPEGSHDWQECYQCDGTGRRQTSL